MGTLKDTNKYYYKKTCWSLCTLNKYLNRLDIPQEVHLIWMDIIYT